MSWWWNRLPPWWRQWLDPYRRLYFLDQRVKGQEQTIRHLRAKMELIETLSAQAAKDRDELMMLVEEIHRLVERHRGRYVPSVPKRRDHEHSGRGKNPA